MGEAPDDSVSVPKEYAWWWNALSTGELPPVDSELETGRYRRETRGAIQAIAIWKTKRKGAEIIHVQVNDRHTDTTTQAGQNDVLRFEMERWPQCQAVTAEEYDAAMAAGRWENQAPLIPFGRSRQNREEPGDIFEANKRTLEDLKDRADGLLRKKLGPADDPEEHATAAQNLKAQIDKLVKAHETARLVITGPLQAAWKAEVSRWTTAVTDPGTALAKRIEREIVEPWLREKQRKLDEQRRKEVAEQRAAEKAAMERAAAAPAGAPIAPVERAPEPERQLASVGSKGMAAKIAVKKQVVVDDWEKLAAYLAGEQVQNQAVRDEILKAARRMFGANEHAAIPGARYVEVETTKG